MLRTHHHLSPGPCICVHRSTCSLLPSDIMLVPLSERFDLLPIVLASSVTHGNACECRRWSPALSTSATLQPLTR